MAANANTRRGTSLFARAALRASLVDLDPELFAGVGPRELMRVRELAAHTVELDPGVWEPRISAPDAGLGLLVVDGLLVRTVTLGDEVAAELVAPGDVIRPWEASADGGSIIRCAVGWTVLSRARLAILGRRLTLAASDCPGLVAALLERVGRRSRSQGILTAVAHMKRVDVRVLVLLWHVAERCGRVTTDGVVVPLRLTHQRIAQLVGAQRPSVTAALSRMTARGLLLQTADRSFVLTERAQEELDVLCREGERGLAPLLAECA